MTEHIITLADHEASRFKETGSLLVVRPVVPQPPKGTHSLAWNANEGEDLPHLWLADNDYGEYPGDVDFDPYVRCPFGAPGDVLVCKEAWGVTDMYLKPEYALAEFNSGEPTAAYTGSVPGPYDIDDIKAHTVYRTNSDRAFFWRSSTTMPAWAVRFRPVVREAGVMRTGDVSSTDIESMGIAVSKITMSIGDSDGVLETIVAETNTRRVAAYWNHRFRKYPWESNPWCWTAWVETPEAAARDEWAQREADKRRAMLEDMWWEEQNA